MFPETPISFCENLQYASDKKGKLLKDVDKAPYFGIES